MEVTQKATPQLAILGCGFMGTAILQGLLEGSKRDEWQYAACVRSPASLERLRGDIAGHESRVIAGGADAAVNMAREADVVMLGCVPGDLDALLGTPGLVPCLANKLVISLLAGISTEQLLSSFSGFEGEAKFNVARVIPSIGAKIGDSVTLLAKSASLSDADEQTVSRLFSCIGSVLPVPEKLMNDATAIGAVCHALSIHAVDAITDASVAEGMDRPTAARLAAQTLRSSSNLFCAGDMTPEQLKTAMSTPQGITINSVLRLQTGQVPAGIADAVRAAVQYSRSM